MRFPAVSEMQKGALTVKKNLSGAELRGEDS